MTDNRLPIHETRKLTFENGTAIGVSNRWVGGWAVLLDPD